MLAILVIALYSSPNRDLERIFRKMKPSRRSRIGLNLSETVLIILTQFGVLVYAAASFEHLLRRPSEDPGEVPLLLQRRHDLLCGGDGTFEERVFGMQDSVN